MLIPNHPAEERLAALASQEPDATADATLTAHVASCHRCTTVIDELGALRSALAELPDLVPSRPLRLIPPVADARAPAAGGLAGWARRFFAPVLASGAALALVGMIGTAAPSLGGLAGSAQSADSAQTEEAAAAPAGAAAASEPAAAASAPADLESDRAMEFSGGGDDAEAEEPTSAEGGGAVATNPLILQDTASPVPERSAGREALAEDPAEAFRIGEDLSPWPIVLFAGIALMLAAVLFRYVLAPRAG